MFKMPDGYNAKQPSVVEMVWTRSGVWRGPFLLPGSTAQSETAFQLSDLDSAPGSRQACSLSGLGAFQQSFDSAPSGQVQTLSISSA